MQVVFQAVEFFWRKSQNSKIQDRCVLYIEIDDKTSISSSTFRRKIDSGTNFFNILIHHDNIKEWQTLSTHITLKKNWQRNELF